MARKSATIATPETPVDSSWENPKSIPTPAVKVERTSFSVNVGEMQAALAIVSRAIASRPSMAILANVLVEASAGQVTLTGFDLALGISISIPATVKESGKTTVSGKLFCDIFAHQEEGEATFESELSNGSTEITLIFASGKYKLRGIWADEFPELPAIATEPFTLPSETLVQAVQKVLYAAAVDQSKQVLTGVHFSITPEELEVVTTDGHRMAKASALFPEQVAIAPQEGAEVINITVPAKAIGELARLVDRQKAETVSVCADASQIRFSGEGWMLTSRLIEGQYPDYNRLVPTQFAYRVGIVRKNLLGALERIAILADQKNSVVKLEFQALLQVVRISAEATDVGSGSEELNIDMQVGTDITIAFDVRYILDALKHSDTTDIELCMNSPLSPVVVMPKAETSWLGLIMPVQTR